MSDAATPPGDAIKRPEASGMTDNAAQQPHAAALPVPSTSNAFAGAAISGGKRTRSHGTEQHPREGKVTSYNIFCTSVSYHAIVSISLKILGGLCYQVLKGICCLQVRKEMKRENAQTPAREIERLIGQRWQQMTTDEKKPYEEVSCVHRFNVPFL